MGFTREFSLKEKRSSIIVAAEGIGDCRVLTAKLGEQTGFDGRLTTLGYVQRGGAQRLGVGCLRASSARRLSTCSCRAHRTWSLGCSKGLWEQSTSGSR